MSPRVAGADGGSGPWRVDGQGGAGRVRRRARTSGEQVVAWSVVLSAEADAERGVVQALGDEFEDLAFAVGELREQLAGASWGFPEVVEDAAGHGGSEGGVALIVCRQMQPRGGAEIRWRWRVR